MTFAESLDILDNFPEFFNSATKTKISTCRSNVVAASDLRDVQLQTLETLAQYLALTFGPMGSNAKILKGNDDQTIMSEYSKDGHKVLKNIKFNNPIEMSIKAELVDITHHVERQVGDGTTSAVILSSKIFRNVLGIMNNHKDIPPYEIIYSFKKVVSTLQEKIMEKGNPVTLQDIYDICMISTNGNEEISNNITNIYSEHGFDVSIDVNISTTNDTMTKTYDGLTVNEGYSDPVYINNKSNGTSEIHNAKVYAFIDPIDTPGMISLFEKIIMNNIIEPLNGGEDCIPTVIISPKMTRDMSALMKQLVEIMYTVDESQRPPLLIITDIGGLDENAYLDIAMLCGCKYIKKYIDPEIQKMDEDKGLAANLDNIIDFCGECELVVADVAKTKFINPADMYTTDENGEVVPTNTYTTLLNFLKAELEHAKANGEDLKSVGGKRKRLKSLQSNMVEYLVGGISIADRDSARDLVEDAVKNCASACQNGVGNAANFEGFRAAFNLIEDNSDTIEYELAVAIYKSYCEVIELLYNTVGLVGMDMINAISNSLENGCPLNLRTKEFDGLVKTSITTDIKILEAISKIVTIMVTSNQCILQAPQLNTYS